MEGKGQKSYYWYELSFWKGVEVLEMHYGDGCTMM